MPDMGRSYADKAGRLLAQLQRSEAEVERLREDLAEAEAMRDHNHTVAERLRARVNSDAEIMGEANLKMQALREALRWIANAKDDSLERRCALEALDA